MAEQKLRGLAISDKKIFYSVGNEEGSFREDVLKFNKLVTADSSGKLEHEYKEYPFDSHMTEPVPAYYDALRFIYKNWAPDITK